MKHPCLATGVTMARVILRYAKFSRMELHRILKQNGMYCTQNILISVPTDTSFMDVNNTLCSSDVCDNSVRYIR